MLDKIKNFFTWLFRGSAETQAARADRKAHENVIKKFEDEAYWQAKKEQALVLSEAKAKYETEQKIKNIKEGGWIGKIAKGLDNASKNMAENSKGGKGKSKGYQPMDLFGSEPTKSKKAKPLDFSDIKIEY